MNYILDTFSGAGFGSHGFKKHFNVVEAIDIDKDACNSYQLNHKQTKIICDDIRNINFSHHDYDGIVGLLGTPPCQSFSVLNQKRNIYDDRANLSIEFLRILNEIKPKFALFENVYSIPKIYKERLIKEIEKIGYNVVSQIVNAWEYGSYQIRRRWIITIHYKKHLFPQKINLLKRKKARDILTNEKSEITPREETLRKIQNLPTGKWVALPGQSFKTYFVIDPDKPFPAIVNPTKLRYIHPNKKQYIALKNLISAFGVNTNKFFLTGTLSKKGQQLANGFPADLAFKFSKIFYENLN